MDSKRGEAPKYKSKLEHVVGVALGPKWPYEPMKVPYTTYRNYNPDFVYQGPDGIQLLVEVKGFFRVGDTQKYKAIRDCLKPHQTLVFYLQNANTKVRKGAKMNMGQWCDKEGFEWFECPKELKKYGEAFYGHI